MDLPDSDILEGITNGDKKIFDLVFKKYYSGLCTFANDYLRSLDIAQEIVQEVFLYLWENRGRLQIQISLKAYLYRSVYNRCMNYIRDNTSLSYKKINIDQLKNQSDLLFIEIPDTIFDTSFSDQIEQELEQTIEGLPEQCKMIFRLSRYENLSYPEIAHHLDISLSTVKTQMSRAMNKLHEKMSKYL
jgi:RNA polymerase sigma-70 factor, ECF subfamily